MSNMKVASHIWVSRMERRQPEKVSPKCGKLGSGCAEKAQPITDPGTKEGEGASLSRPEHKREVRINKRLTYFAHWVTTSGVRYPKRW